jgi:hypothetical protein
MQGQHHLQSQIPDGNQMTFGKKQRKDRDQLQQLANNA